MDFNNRHKLSNQLTEKIDEALQTKQRTLKNRDYLGASRLGVSCDRALQFEYLHKPIDEGRKLTGQTLRTFQAGHVFENLAADWLRAIGFKLITETSEGKQYGFDAVKGQLKGHIDGVLLSGPKEFNLTYPALWECKSLKASSWRDILRRGLSVSKPIYATQIALYQAYMEAVIPGISHHPALFSAINKNTSELYFELVPFDGELAQRMSDRAVKIFKACEADEWLSRVSNDPSFFECKFCNWQQHCWRN